MTREKAIEVLKSECYILPFLDGDRATLINTALDVAIKALKQESVLDKIKAEIRKWYWQADKQAIAKDPCVVDAMIDLFIRTIDKYKAEREVKDDK